MVGKEKDGRAASSPKSGAALKSIGAERALIFRAIFRRMSYLSLKKIRLHPQVDAIQIYKKCGPFTFFEVTRRVL